MDLQKVAKELINSQLYFSLATYSNDQGWIAPLWYTTDQDFNFYFVSDKNSRHAKHIEQNPKVAFTIFDGNKKPDDVIGIQVEASASLVNIFEIPKVLKLIYAKSGSESFKENLQDWDNPETYHKLTDLRIYKVIPIKIWILDVNSDEDNKRIEITLAGFI